MMECPHCKYNDEEVPCPPSGEFYILRDDNGNTLEVKRGLSYGNDVRSVYACPNCSKMFIG